MLLSKFMKRFGTLLAMIGLMGAQMSPAYAGMVGTTTVLEQAQRSVDRAELLEMLDRESVQNQLEGMGVDAEAAKMRVAAMTDEEIGMLNERLADMPAGSSDAVGIIILFLVIFIITDLLGATNIFPFIHPIR